MTDTPSPSRPSLLRPVLLLAAVIAVIALSRWLGLGERLGALRDWIGTLGAAAPLVFAVVYSLATVAALPGVVFSVAAGAMFGPVVGVLSVIAGSTVGASLAFLVSRHLARGAVSAWLKDNERFRRLDDLTERHGAIIVAITRLVPLFPFNLLNYGFGLTRVPFWTYAGWSALCMLPGTILYVVGSAALFQTAAEGRVPWALILVVALIVAILAVLVRMARKRLQEEAKPNPGASRLR